MKNDFTPNAVWRCDKCGAIIDGQFDICMKCGNIKPRETKPEPEIAFENEQAENSVQINIPEKENAKKKPKKSSKGLIFAVLFLLVVAGIIAFVLVDSSKKAHEKAVESFEAGDYLTAISEAEKDLFFSEDIRLEAIKKHAMYQPHRDALAFLDNYSDLSDIPQLIGQLISNNLKYYYEAEDFENAIELIEKNSAELGDTGLLEETVYGYAEYLCEKNRFDSAIDLTEDHPSLENTTETIGMIKYRKVEYLVEKARNDRYLKNGESYYSEALEILGELDPEKYDVAALYDEIYLYKALDALDDGNTASGREHIAKVKDDPLAKTYQDAFELMDKAQLYEAAKLLRKTEDSDNTVSMEEWREILEDYEVASKDEFASAFTSGAIDAALFGTPLNFALEEPENMDYRSPNHQEIAGGFEVTEETLAKCTGKDTGKMLVMWEINGYITHEVEYFIAWDIMRYLPEEYYPFSPEEVEYIVKISCSASSHGWYRFDDQNVPAVAEKVTVTCTRPSNVRVTLYGSDSVYGEYAPDYVSVYAVPDFISGGMPPKSEVSQLIFDAMKDIATHG